MDLSETSAHTWAQLIYYGGPWPDPAGIDPLAEFVKVCATTDVQPGKMKMVQLGTEKVCLSNVNGKYHAIGDVCTHVGGPLSQGLLTDRTVTCPWHGSQFDVATGEVKRGPARMPEPVYEVKVEGTSVLVKSAK
ncbi:non-heme iron oxygenase ferredoxin subunit [Candidatus Bathyarchaeota archaeon]|nr:MAG: non-heme iron oxygenase ferredoxin subunit [Candidatus Bathyarchaeota archaeon]TMI30851.1 MAG: non-heme iron oxygenase ferredoxin subunit [Candidatus Bathyarchaeota archaeon]